MDTAVRPRFGWPRIGFHDRTMKETQVVVLALPIWKARKTRFGAPRDFEDHRGGGVELEMLVRVWCVGGGVGDFCLGVGARPGST